MPSSDPQSNAPAKHRACDECRSRKLACSKESDGCSRCVREGIKCHYSEQKPMGRPRKRHFTGEIKDNNIDFDSIIPDFDPIPYYDEFTPTDSYMNAANLSFLTEESGQFGLPHEQQGKGLCTVDDGRVIFHFGGDEFNKPIDFGVDDENLEDSSTSVMARGPELPVETLRNPYATCEPAPLIPGPPCSCLASMYLAMSSLQELPNDVETALATVRSAANAAQASIRCEKCGTVAAKASRPPMEVFQNTMLLGTILPIIANGYKRLLVMVDNETDLARAAGANKVFRLSACGGICGSKKPCGSIKHLEEATLLPDEWRLTVRGLLRADVYGIEGWGPGLKGLIAEMEQRQRIRHKLPHDLSSLGPNHELEQMQCLGEKDALCLRIISSAKLAVDSLVIA